MERPAGERSPPLLGCPDRKVGIERGPLAFLKSAPMSRSRTPLQVIVYQDVLCAWCYLAERRLSLLRDELKDLVRWKERPFPMRVHDSVPTQKERARRMLDVRRARLEPEGERLSADLWTQSDVPRSSVPALVALEAAKLQGPSARAMLLQAMRRAALEQGINVSRSDVVFELAAHVGLNMNRFVAAYQSPETKRLVLEEHRIAAERGVRGVPTLVIGQRWMLTGLRELSEYREHLLKCLEKSGLGGGAPDQLVH